MASITRAGLQAAYADEVDGISTTYLDDAVAQANALSLDVYVSDTMATRRRYLEALAVLWPRRGGKSITRQWPAAGGGAANANPWRAEADILDQVGRFSGDVWSSS